jgi:hypothetical protein
LERFRVVNEINEIDTRQLSDVGDTPLRQSANLSLVTTKDFADIISSLFHILGF